MVESDKLYVIDLAWSVSDEHARDSLYPVSTPALECHSVPIGGWIRFENSVADGNASESNFIAILHSVQMIALFASLVSVFQCSEHVIRLFKSVNFE